ncbi:MAG: aspartate/glutamate racemase family protein [Treponema sp.]|jgi:allantoin racemase|nr:aspartate/glutamate racemase family protein [Treponema sp.]
MKILNLIPIVTDIWNDDMQKYVTRGLLPGTEVIPRRITHGPASIECEYDEALALPDIIALSKAAEKEGFDGIFVDCFGDPGVRAAREVVNIPVFGGFEPPILYALGIADRVGIVTVLPNVVPMLRGNVAKAGLQDRVPSIRYVNIPVLDLEGIKKLIAALIIEGEKAIQEDGVEVLVLGCTAMVGAKEEVEAGLKAKGYNITVIEAAQASLLMLETYIRLGWKHGRIAYMPPPPKKRVWWTGDGLVEI